MASDPNLPHQVRVRVEPQRLIDQRRVRTGRGQVDEHARRVLQALVMEGHFHVEFDDDAHDVLQRGAPDCLDRRELRRRLQGGSRRHCLPGGIDRGLLRRRRRSPDRRGSHNWRGSHGRRWSSDGRRRGWRGRLRHGGRPAERRDLRRHLAREPARGILRREELQQPERVRPLARIAEDREGVFRELARPPECVVAVGTGRVETHDVLEVGDDRAHRLQRGRRRRHHRQCLAHRRFLRRGIREQRVHGS